ncbi:MAG TPA: pyridoxine 5'-phosphate synthase [Planctomycetota bacterium]
MTPIRLGVNVDHVATVRQARRAERPDPVDAALASEKAGAAAIVCHLREDRRHIQDRDLAALLKRCRTYVNLEMGLSADILGVALASRPRQVTLVPERRQELTTEGGLDVRGRLAAVRAAAARFQAKDIDVSLFIDPDLRQVSAARRTGATIIELHTGAYANAKGRKARTWELRKIVAAARAARRDGLVVAAGHGLDYENVKDVAAVPEIEELNIGHSIVSRALLVGFEKAVREMKGLMDAARRT